MSILHSFNYMLSNVNLERYTSIHNLGVNFETNYLSKNVFKMFIIA